jgi:hypothetical protein
MTHPLIPSPHVTVAAATSTRWIARCAHCDWTYTNTVKADVLDHAKWHRGRHRTGDIEVTR